MVSRYARHPGRFLTGIGAAGALWLLAGGGIGRARPGRPRAEESLWSVGGPRAIAVHDGRATFRVPTPEPTSEILVVVSALARSRGPYPIQLTVRPVSSASIPVLADDGPRRTPRRSLPVLPPTHEPVDRPPP